ncbi:hypothetical protein CERZMDRAFT_86334 [Cercospora zeae-maydis SCOH1-5]|uniref:Uncharacterized protein n=1 Tax=Cercospora zeae-maydis SCOH1-5 TaxID=717836 RepID=A0A6A6FA85_9PEZI|nr:hypothetical protein CERZMDRAFT_86334 [Cercospora zeae-maydis SCOH1-5]
MYVDQDHMCLGIPVPKSIVALATRDATPQRTPRSTTLIRNIISDFGRIHSRSVEEIDRACELAEGHDDVVILLERLAMDHDYSKPFATFCRASPVLYSLEQLVRFAT